MLPRKDGLPSIPFSLSDSELSLSISSNVSSILPSPTSSRSPTIPLTLSYLISVISIPRALKSPGRRGTITFVIPIDSATSTACIGPAPPNATSAKSRASSPLSRVTISIALAI